MRTAMCHDEIVRGGRGTRRTGGQVDRRWVARCDSSRPARAESWRCGVPLIVGRLVLIYDYPDQAIRPQLVSLRSSAINRIPAVKIDGHYDRDQDIAWLRFEGYDGQTVVAEEIKTGLR